MQKKDKERHQSTASVYRARAEVLNRLAHILEERKLLDVEVLEEAEHRSRWLEHPLDRVLADDGIVSEEVLRDILSEISGIELCHTGRLSIAPEILEAVPPKAVIRYRVMPLERFGGTVVLLSDRVFDPSEEEPLRVLLGSEIEWRICTRSELSECIKHYYGVGVESIMIGVQGSNHNGKGESGPDIAGFVHEAVV